MTDTSSFAVLDTPCRVWAVASIHGEAGHLARLHAALAPRIISGDRLVYLGNMIGRGNGVRSTVDEILLFRRDFMARRGNDAPDVALLRGAQEEMWNKLFELQFSVNPAEVLEWMLDQGVAASIESYGARGMDGLIAARQGTIALGRWTTALRDVVRATPGHRDYLSALRQAAYVKDGSLVFVSAGIEPERPLDAQGDILWWGGRGFDQITDAYYGCRLVVRGFDSAHGGMNVTEFAATIDGGCGFGGPLIAACVSPTEGIVEIIEG
jgi:serine/threonine protein phosphatase 1